MSSLPSHLPQQPPPSKLKSPSPIKTTTTTTTTCQECHEKESRYACPRCLTRTCSLQCCVLHKRRLQCNGKRDRTKFVPLARMDDALLRSDYHFLEDVLGNVDAGKRLMRTVGGAGGGSKDNRRNATNKCNQNGKTTEQSSNQEGTAAASTPPTIPIHPMLSAAASCSAPTTEESKAINDLTTDSQEPQHRVSERAQTSDVSLRQSLTAHHSQKWRRLVQQAEDRGVTLLLMPPGMERHKHNATYCHANTIYWKVEFCVHHVTPPLSLSVHRVSEHTLVVEELERLLRQQQHSSETLSILPQCHLLLKRLPCPSHKPLYVELNRSSTLRTALQGMTIIEYPTIHVVLQQDLERFPRFIQEL